MLDIKDYSSAERVFHFFEEISKIPHASENTAPIADYLVNFAKERSLSYYRDSADNVIIRKPATAGYENRPTVIFQGHTDMVADKTPSSTFDFERDSLQLYRDGDFIRARGTTLGGDDGVALAYSLAILDSSDIPHPNFEALFTSNEEIGLLGASALDAGQLKGKTMINIDSDEEGVFTVGCAGGMRMDLKIPIKRLESCEKLTRVRVSGLIGGHSGTEIDKGRINAIRLLAELLSSVKGLRLASISGGNADNAIPRFAEAVFICESDGETLSALADSIKTKYIGKEPDIAIEISCVSSKANLLSPLESKGIIECILKTPTGVYKMSEEIKGLPETSSNVGIVATEDTEVTVSVSLRSSKNSEKAALRDKIKAIGLSFGASIEERGEYPAWEYKKDSTLPTLMSDLYRTLYGKEPKVVTIHAGLECGIFSEKIEGLECVSIGPDNYDIHTTEERLSISSVARVYEYLKEILKRI